MQYGNDTPYFDLMYLFRVVLNVALIVIQYIYADNSFVTQDENTTSKVAMRYLLTE